MTTRAKWALAFAGGCLALLALLWYAASSVGVFERADRHVFVSFYNLTYPYYRHRVHATASFLVSLCDPAHYAFMALLPAVVALARRRIREACAVVVLVFGAGATALLLKHLGPQPRGGTLFEFVSPVPYPRFPSGHATAAMALVLALTLVVPARLRSVTAGLGAVFAAAVGYSLLTIGSHYPSDVVAGFLVAATWSLLTAAALFEVERRLGGSPSQIGRISIREAITPPVVAMLAILALAAIIVVSDPQLIVSYIRAHGAFTAGGIVIAVLSTLVATGVELSVRGDVIE